MKNRMGITLISLVITIMVLIILATVSIVAITGEGGILQKAVKGEAENKKQTATEIINLKITTIQMATYAEKQKMPSLQELANGLCNDEKDEIEYVYTTSQKVGKNPEIIEIGEATSIFTKLREYPYEFEINRNLQLASIDGIKIADTESNTISREEYDELKVRLERVEREQEYHVGDTIKYTGSLITPGILTSSRTLLVTTLLLGKNIGPDVTAIEFSTSSFNIRAEDKYLIKNEYSESSNFANYFVATKKGNNAIQFRYQSSSAFSVNNNICVSFELSDLIITFK